MKSTTIAPAAARRPFAEGLAEPEPAVLEIRGRFYVARPMPADEGVKVVRVLAMDDPDATYDVSRGADGLVVCTCPDYLYRHENTAGTCKHGDACIKAGLLAPAAPVANDVPAVDPWDVEGPAETWPADTDSDVWVADEPADDEPTPAPKAEAREGIPAAVRRIRVIMGGWERSWFYRTDRPGFEPHWAAEGDERRWMPCDTADGLYRVGKVAIPKDAPEPVAPVADVVPVEPTTPAVEPEPTFRGVNRIARWFMPSAADVAYEEARSIGLEAEMFIEPPAGYSIGERAGWFAGMASALIELDAMADREATSRFDHNVWGEARMPLPGDVRD